MFEEGCAFTIIRRPAQDTPLHSVIPEKAVEIRSEGAGRPCGTTKLLDFEMDKDGLIPNLVSFNV